MAERKYVANEEQRKRRNAYWKAWRTKNPEKFKATQKRSYLKNKERKKTTLRAWYDKNREQIRLRAKLRRAANPEEYSAKEAAKHQKYKRYYQNRSCMRKYGITLERKNQLLAEQGSCCAICKTSDPGTGRHAYWCVDHDHTTKRIRGILCLRCNTSLAVLENPTLLASMQQYLIRNGSDV